MDFYSYIWPAMNAKLTFLGTGTSQGVPIIGCDCEVCRSSDPRDKRLRSSVLVEYGGLTMVVDAGPDFRYQMLRADGTTTRITRAGSTTCGLSTCWNVIL